MKRLILIPLMLVSTLAAAYVIKESKQDEDFKVYVNDGGVMTSALTIDGATTSIGMGLNSGSPDTTLHLFGATSGTTNLLKLGSTGGGVGMLSIDATGNIFRLGHSSDTDALTITSAGIVTATNAMKFATSGGTAASLNYYEEEVTTSITFKNINNADDQIITYIAAP